MEKENEIHIYHIFCLLAKKVKQFPSKQHKSQDENITKPINFQLKGADIRQLVDLYRFFQGVVSVHEFTVDSIQVKQFLRIFIPTSK